MSTGMDGTGTGGLRERADWRVRLVVPLGLLALAVLGRTWRFRVRNDAGWRRLQAERRPFIFALWHGTLLPLTFHHRRRGITALISEHRDGEVIARIVHAWGYRTIRGSTTRGAGRALLSIIRELESGSIVAVTPDGPRGPAREFQPGAAIAAQRAGAPIVPILMRVDRAWRLHSWDRFVVPKPFARIDVVYGPPTEVLGANPREAVGDVPRLTALMESLQREADADR